MFVAGLLVGLVVGALVSVVVLSLAASSGRAERDAAVLLDELDVHEGDRDGSAPEAADQDARRRNDPRAS